MNELNAELTNSERTVSKPGQAEERVRALASGKGTLLSICIVLVGSSLSPFALAEAGAFSHNFFYFALMPLLLFRIAMSGSIRINPLIGVVLCVQMITLSLAFLGSGTEGHLKTMVTLLSVVIVSVLFCSNIVDIRSFVNVAVLFTIAVLVLSAISFFLALSGYFQPIPLFSRPGGAEVVYRIGWTLSNEVQIRGSGYFIRPGGVFVEAGQLAMYAILAILANATILRNRKYELLLIVGGLFTTSQAFYLFLIIFFIIFRRWRALAIFGVGIFLGLLAIGGMAMVRDDLVLNSTAGRFLRLFDSDFGGNRMAPSLRALEKVGQFNLFRGADIPELIDIEVEATIWGPLLSYGVLGGVLAYLHVVIFGAVPMLLRARHDPRSSRATTMLAIFVIMALNLLHRPFTYHFLYYVYLVAMFEWEWRRIIGDRMKSKVFPSAKKVRLVQASVS